MRRLYTGERNWVGRYVCDPYTYTMSKPASRARRAAATQSSWTRRMSAPDIAFGTLIPSKSLESCDGASGGRRDSRVSA